MTDLVLIHGAWLSSGSWENFSRFFAERGYDVEAPEWPRKDGDVQSLRRNGDALKGLGIQEIVDHYDERIRGRDPQPVIMGHSFGGLFTQILLARGLGAAGVALDPAPPKGMYLLPPSMIKAASPALFHPSKRRGVVELDADQFRFGFTNTWPDDEATAAYEREAVPDTGRILYQAAFAMFAPNSPAKVDFRRSDRAPLLITAGEKDNTVAASIARANHRKYRRSGAVTDFVEFPGRSHLLMAGPGWEEVATYVADWLDKQLKR